MKTLLASSINYEIFESFRKGKHKNVYYSDSESSNTTSLFEIVSDLLSHLEKKKCTIKNLIEIREFLIENTSYIKYIKRSLLLIFKYFNFYQETSLELFYDQEYDNEPKLFLNVRTDKPADEAIKILNEIDKEFIPIVVDNEIKNFNINIEFLNVI